MIKGILLSALVRCSSSSICNHNTTISPIPVPLSVVFFFCCIRSNSVSETALNFVAQQENAAIVPADRYSTTPDHACGLRHVVLLV